MKVSIFWAKHVWAEYWGPKPNLPKIWDGQWHLHFYIKFPWQFVGWEWWI